MIKITTSKAIKEKINNALDEHSRYEWFGRRIDELEKKIWEMSDRLNELERKIIPTHDIPTIK